MSCYSIIIANSLGMLSKSRGQILRISAVFHVMFHVDISEPIPSEVSEMAIQAAINFVKTSIQHVAYISGKGVLEEEYEKYMYKPGKVYNVEQKTMEMHNHA